MTFLKNGVEKNYIQIGTVMTDEAYRRLGLANKLMDHVVKQYKDDCDGFYLFANLDAVDFYDKCGFSKEAEYCYSVKNEFCMRKSAGEIFMPVNTTDEQMDICVAEQYDGADDYRLFYLGEQLKSIENEKLYFPELSHA